MKLTSNCTDLVKHFESLHDGDLKQIGLQPKMCPAGIWTEGYGHCIIDPKTGKFLKGTENKARAYELSTVKTEKEASEQLAVNLKEYSAKVRKVLKFELNDNEFSALVSFAYNLCVGKIESFNLEFPKLRSEADAMNFFLKYRFAKVDGVTKELAGLVRRRKAEAWLYNYGSLKLSF